MLASGVAFLTLAWAAVATLAPWWGVEPAIGLALFAWRAVAVALAAVMRAVFLDDRLFLPLGAGFDPALGTWQAWATFALLAPAIALLLARAPRGDVVSRAALLGLAFLGPWGFALFRAPILTTLHLVPMGAALVALHHLGAWRRAPGDANVGAGLLIGGAAATLASLVAAYATGPWVSILTGVVGVAFLSAGVVLRAHATYRYVGFAALGLVVLRVFVVDLRETDLVIRALVSAVLGGILLGVGSVYARRSRVSAGR